MNLAAVLGKITIPPWLLEETESLVAQAERVFVGNKRGSDKKQFVEAALDKLLAKHNIEAIPDWLETPAKQALVHIAIELVVGALKQNGGIRRYGSALTTLVPASVEL